MVQERSGSQAGGQRDLQRWISETGCWTADEEERRCCLCMCGAGDSGDGEHNTPDASFPKHIMSEGGKLLHPTLP